ncbi:glycosyltransferase family 39 protein [aff. Roholtiella sp. LEGE 12411]|uniref:glycosyltransferase family 39 protein n=1 Tax=aff. Roholtiella sp. LEGE 12411 TaxID=1828822 RepID=UPI001881ECCD|nr:glycosyltransferase family 39 protein [aff. Roholtiella sp. LEGE 12411]MBE9037222.1 glycosyltransferase family 39 protein [aff. Roholtiella sp. LEGE 12411]
MNRLERWLPIGLVLTLGLLLGLLGFSIWEKIPTPVERVAWSEQAQWIAPQSPTYRFYARQTFYLPDSAKAGWLRLSADNDFILYVNGREVTRENSVLNTSTGLGAKLKLPSQSFNDSNTYNIRTTLNYVLGAYQDWKLTAYIDLTSYMRPGKNVIGLEIQKGQQNPRVVVEGAVYADATTISLTTGVTSWRVSNFSETRQSLQWFDQNFRDENWPEAKVLSSVKESTYSRLSKNLFDRPLQGNWIQGDQNDKGQIWLRSVWRIPADPITHAYIRFAGKGEYSLLINGILINNYRTENGNKLHLLEVTKFLQAGKNILAVSLASPLDAIVTGNNPININGILSFSLDGWAETDKNEIVGAIATDKNNWTTLKKPVSGWSKGVGEGQPVTILGLRQPEVFQRSFEGNAYLLNYPNYLWHQSIWLLGGTAFAMIYSFVLGFWVRREYTWWNQISTGAAILSPATLFLIGIGLLKHRYAEAENGLLFAQQHSNYIILTGFISIVLLTLLFIPKNSELKQFNHQTLWFLFGISAFVCLSLAAGGNIIIVLFIASGITALALFWTWGNWQFRDIYAVLQLAWRLWSQWLLLGLIVSIGFGMRVYNLGFQNLDVDENVSLDAARGILRTGIPIATSGIWYTRGPFYQYLLAFWLRLVGDSIFNARLLSVIWGTATLILVYILTCKITGKVWIALLTIVVLAIDPWQIWYSRFIRFYPVLQFLTIFCIWSFLNGFIDKKERFYQYIFFIALTLSLLTQEINLTIIPGFIIGFLYFYRPFSFLNDWQIVLGSITTLSIFIFNLAFAAIKLLTPLAALSDATASYLRLHFSDVTSLLSTFFIGPDRIRIIYSLFFLLGIIYSFKKRDIKIIFLFTIIFINIFLVTCLTYNLAERYLYGIYPLFIILSIYSGICIIESFSRRINYILNGLLSLRIIFLSFILLIFISNIQFGRVLDSYQQVLLRSNTQLFDYISNHRRSGDIVISSAPAFAPNSLGKLDYYLFTPLRGENFDLLYWRNGRLIDRWGGGEVVNSIDRLNAILDKSQRIWIHIDDVRHFRVTPELSQYVQTLGKPVYETFGSRLRLWQPGDGLPSRIPNEGKDLGAY